MSQRDPEKALGVSLRQTSLLRILLLLVASSIQVQERRADPRTPRIRPKKRQESLDLLGNQRLRRRISAELGGFEPPTFGMQSQRSTEWATAPNKKKRIVLHTFQQQVPLPLLCDNFREIRTPSLTIEPQRRIPTFIRLVGSDFMGHYRYSNSLLYLKPRGALLSPCDGQWMHTRATIHRDNMFPDY